MSVVSQSFDLVGIEEWEVEQDREYEALREVASQQAKIETAFTWAALGAQEPPLTPGVEYALAASLARTPLGPRFDHARLVSKASGRLAETYFADRVMVNDRLYHVAVCRLGGLLHEAIRFCGVSYEELAALTDKAVADVVGALSAHNGVPQPRRLDLLANQLGHGGPTAQLVKLVDFVCEASDLEELLDAGGTVPEDRVRRLHDELLACLPVMTTVKDHRASKSLMEAAWAFQARLGEILRTDARRRPRLASV